MIIPIQKADSESSVTSCIHTATCEQVAMKIFLGLPGESEAGYLGNVCVTSYFPS